MKRKVVLPAIAVVLVGLWMILVGQGAEDLAELYVTKIVLDPPSTISRGEVVGIYTRVMNTGARSADGFNISFFYRLQDNAGNWTLHETVEGISLPPSHQDFYEITFHLDTMDLDLGTYDLRIVADSANHISETDELNNELRTTMTLQDSSLGLPDLQPVSLSYVHTNPSATDDMEPWNVSTQIRNLGEFQAGQFVVTFSVDGTEFARQIRFVLPAGGVTDITAELDPQSLALDPGTHQIAVVIDPDDEVVEQNEGNNTVSGSLTLQSVELVPLSLVFDKSIIRLDEEIRVSAEIRNDGEGVAKGIEVAFYAGHVRFASGTIDILGRGMTATVEGILDPEKEGLTDAPAVYEIRVVVDPNDLLHEFDEANNAMTRTLTIHPPEVKKPELHPESIELSPSSPAELGRADSVTVSTTIKNTGRAAAEDFTVAYYYRVKGGLRWEPFQCTDAVSCQGLSLDPDMQTRLVGVLPVLVLPPGVYEIRVLVDPDGAIPELDESNNELATTLTLLASRLPDLAFCPEGALAIEPQLNVHRGQTVRLTPCITNLGEQDAGPFTVRLSYCPLTQMAGGIIQCSETYHQSYFSPDATIDVSGLAIGRKIEIPVMLETRDLEPGQYQIHVEVDPDHDVRERDELNNSLAGTLLTVLGPDLAVVDLTTSSQSVIDQAVTDELQVTTTVINTGVVATGDFTVRFRLLRVAEQGTVAVPVHACGEAAATDCTSSENFAEVTLPGIGVLVPEQVRWTLDLVEASLDPGLYILRVEADCEGDVDGDDICDGKISEHNELNNALELSLTVLPRPADLAVAGPIEFPDGTPVEYGQVVPIKATIANVGGSTAVGACGTTPSCGIGVEFLIYEYGEHPDDGERIVRITPLERIPALEVGEAVEVTAILETELLDPMVTGYRVCVRVDPSGSIPELDESNNELCTPPQLELYPPPPDLRVASEGLGRPIVRFDPVPPVEYQNQPIRAYFSIVNDSRSASTGFNIALRLRQANEEEVPWIELGRLAVAGMAAGELRPFSYDIVLPSEEVEGEGDEEQGLVPPGVYEFCIVVDVDGFVPETDEQNNVYCTPVGLIILDDDAIVDLPEEGADLTIKSMCAQIAAGWMGLSSVKATIANLGTADAGPFTVTAYYIPAVGADPVAIIDSGHATRYDGLAVGEDASFRQDFDTAGLENGTYPVFIVIDSASEVVETDEDNNIMYDTLWIH